MNRILKTIEKEENHYNAEKKFYDKKLLKRDVLPSKSFEEKNSLLVDLLENIHGATFYNLFVTILVSLYLYALTYNYLYKQEINLGINLLIQQCFKLHIAISIWLGMFAASFLCYYGFKIWAFFRIKLPQNSTKAKLWDKFMIGLVFIYYSLFLYWTPFLNAYNKISPGLSMFLLSESLRMIMMFHSYIRTNAPRVLRSKKENEGIVVPSLQNFLYFYFAPTLIYRDVYPRSQNRNWKIIFGYVCELCTLILLLSLLFEFFYLNQLEDYGLRPYSGNEIIIIFVKNSMISLLLHFTTFYMFMHIWLNAFAELMKFSDRTFYSDWWNCFNNDRYYRAWNTVVYNWLYTYIYKDFYEHIYFGDKAFAKSLVFFISAVFHEYLFGFPFGFCLPIFFLQFIVIGIPFRMLQVKPNSISNMLVFYMLALGDTAITILYTMEYYSRINCLRKNFTVYDYFVPRLLSCNK